MLATERATRVRPVVIEGRRVRLGPLTVGHTTAAFPILEDERPALKMQLQSRLDQ